MTKADEIIMRYREIHGIHMDRQGLIDYAHSYGVELDEVGLDRVLDEDEEKRVLAEIAQEAFDAMETFPIPQ